MYFYFSHATRIERNREGQGKERIRQRAASSERLARTKNKHGELLFRFIVSIMVSNCFDFCNETIVKLALIYVFFISHMPQEWSGIERDKANRGEDSEQRAANAWREPRTYMVSYCF